MQQKKPKAQRRPPPQIVENYKISFAVGSAGDTSDLLFPITDYDKYIHLSVMSIF